MHRIDTPTAQTDKFGAGKNGFTNGDPATGRRATDLNSDMWDAVQEEICNAIEKSGITLNKNQHDQLYQAIVKIITSKIPDALIRSNNLSDLVDTVIARSNLGLGSAAVKDAQTSINDVTPGKVLVNGGAIAVRGVAASQNPAATVTDVNDLPGNSVSFVYADAKNNPGLTGSLLDFSGLGGGYNVQLAASYALAGLVKLRTKNGDVNTWGEWATLYTTDNKPTPDEIGAVSAAGGGYNGILGMNQFYTNATEGGNTTHLYTPPGPYPSYSMVSCNAYNWYGTQILAGLIRGVSQDVLGWGVTVNGSRIFHVNPQGHAVAAGGVFESGGAVRVYSPNNPQPIDLTGWATQVWVNQQVSNVQNWALQNFVQNIDLTAPAEVEFIGSAGYPRATDGAAMYNYSMVGGNANTGHFIVRYTRKLINNNWYVLN